MLYLDIFILYYRFVDNVKLYQVSFLNEDFFFFQRIRIFRLRF